MKLSIITVNLNNENGLAHTIKSIDEQKFKDFEHIVVDGSSVDGSVALLKLSEKDGRKWISEKDNGIYAAMNKGWKMANGEYCLFLNSGDVLHDPDVLERLSKNWSGSDLVYGDLTTVDKEGKEVLRKAPPHFGIHEFMISTIWHPSVFIRRELLERAGGYLETFRLAGDYEFFLRSVLKLGASAVHVSGSVAKFDLQGVSNNRDSAQRMEKEREEAWKCNFSSHMIALFKKYVTMQRSSELRTGRILSKLLPV